jgi:hypothetical protein
LAAASRSAYSARRSTISGERFRSGRCCRELLGRNGRMVAVIEQIGRGDLTAEAVPFRLELE